MHFPIFLRASKCLQETFGVVLQNNFNFKSDVTQSFSKRLKIARWQIVVMWKWGKISQWLILSLWSNRMFNFFHQGLTIVMGINCTPFSLKKTVKMRRLLSKNAKSVEKIDFALFALGHHSMASFIDSGIY